MNLTFLKPADSTVLNSLWLDGVDPLTEPFSVSSRLTAHISEMAGEKLIGMLHQFVLGSDSYLLLHNTFKPIKLAPTPKTFLSAGDTSWYHGGYTALTIVAIAKLMPVSYNCENSGQLIINLTVLDDVGKMGEKSRGALRGHTDACSFPFAHEFKKTDQTSPSPSPDFVVLIGYRNPDKVPTCVAPLSKIMKSLPDWAIAELMKDQFLIGSQMLFKTDHYLENSSVITHHPSFGYQVRFSHSNVTADSELKGAVAAIQEMEKATQACLQDVVVEPGDILFINNRTALHGRREVGEQSGGESRWLQRLYANLPGTGGRPADDNVPFCLAP